MKNTGSCLCGKITFEVDSFLSQIGHCHCKMCQKFHGAAFSTFAEVKLTDLHWLTGKTLINSYRADNDSVRKFCQCCGSSLFFESCYNRSANTVEIALAAFDQFKQLDCIQPDAHIYIESKVPWLTLNDNLPQYHQYRK
jgi:hypothetical protein